MFDKSTIKTQVIYKSVFPFKSWKNKFGKKLTNIRYPVSKKNV